MICKWPGLIAQLPTGELLCNDTLCPPPPTTFPDVQYTLASLCRVYLVATSSFDAGHAFLIFISLLLLHLDDFLIGRQYHIERMFSVCFTGLCACGSVAQHMPNTCTSPDLIPEPIHTHCSAFPKAWTVSQSHFCLSKHRAAGTHCGHQLVMLKVPLL